MLGQIRYTGANRCVRISRVSDPSESGEGDTMTTRQLWIAFASVTASTFMVNVDSSIVNVALPTLSRQFHLSVGALEWTVTMYLLVITAILPVVAKLADILGRRRVFVTGLTIFVIGSALCGLSTGFTQLVAARGLQGVGGAIMQANVMSIVTLMFPENMRGRALGMIGSVVAGGTLMGPILGGVLIAAFGWPSIFYVNVPIGLWGIFGTLRYVPVFPGTPLRGRFDWLGGTLFAAFVVAFLTLFADLSGHIVIGRDLVLALVAVFTLAWFIRQEVRVKEPLVTLAVFRERLFSMAMGAGLLYWILMLFPAFLMPLYLGHVLHFGALQIGLLMIPLSVTMLIVSPLGGYLSDRMGTAKPAVIGIVVFIVANAWLATFGEHTPMWAIVTALALQGAASGLFSSPNNSEIFARADRSLVGVVGGLIASERNFGRSLGVTVAALSLATGISLVSDGKMGGGELGRVPESIFVAGFDGAFWVAVLIAILCLLLVVIPAAIDRRSSSSFS